MNLATIDWQMIGVVIAALGFIYGLHRNSKSDRKEQFSDLRKDMDKRFEHIDKRFEHIDKRFDVVEKDIASTDEAIINLSRNIGSDMSDIIERLSFLESAALYTMPLEPSQLNPRSQAAREMWKRRKAKKLEKKGE